MTCHVEHACLVVVYISLSEQCQHHLSWDIETPTNIQEEILKFVGYNSLLYCVNVFDGAKGLPAPATSIAASVYGCQSKSLVTKNMPIINEKKKEWPYIESSSCGNSACTELHDPRIDLVWSSPLRGQKFNRTRALRMVSSYPTLQRVLPVVVSFGNAPVAGLGVGPFHK
jgi:hypothetical protein